MLNQTVDHEEIACYPLQRTTVLALSPPCLRVCRCSPPLSPHSPLTYRRSCVWFPLHDLNMRALYCFPTLLLLPMWALAATLTVTETQVLPKPLPAPDPTSEEDTYVTTTIFAYHGTDLATTQQDLQASKLTSLQAKTWLPIPTGFVGGIDLIPVVDLKKGKQVKKAEADETIQVGFDKNYFETHLGDQAKDDTIVQAASPYHLRPGYKADESKEEKSKPEKTIDDAGNSVDSNSTTTSFSLETLLEGTSSFDTVESSIPASSITDPVELSEPTASPIPSPPPVQEEDKPFAYDELDEITYWGSPKMDDGSLFESDLKMERLPDEEVLESLIKQPYRGLESGEKMPAPPVKKIMTDHLPPPLPTPTSSEGFSPQKTDLPSNPTSGSTLSKEGTKGKQVRLGDQEDGKVSPANGTATPTHVGARTETKAQKLIREKLLYLKKNKKNLSKTRGTAKVPTSSSKGSFSGRKAELRSALRKNKQHSGSCRLSVSLALVTLCLVLSIW